MSAEPPGAARPRPGRGGALDWERDGAGWPHREASRFVEAAALVWHVQRFAGPPGAPSALLLHGAGGASHSWRSVAPLLSAQLDVWVLDLPGHGFTTRPAATRLSLPGIAGALRALLETLDLAPDLLVGHSAGAAIGARLAIDVGRSESAPSPAALIAFNGAFAPFDGLAGAIFPSLATMLSLNPFAPHMLAWTARGPGAAARVLRETGSRIDPEGEALYSRLMAAPGHIAGTLGMMAQWRLEPLLADLPALPCPAVLAVADGDRAVPPSIAPRVAVRMPEARVEPVAGLGHLAHEEDPAWAAALILSTLSETPASLAEVDGEKS